MALENEEDARFNAARPKTLELWARAKVSMPNGQLYPRAGYTFAPTAPRDAREAEAVEDRLVRRVLRIWLANRGVWEAIIGAGPVVPVPATNDDVDAYVDAFDSCVSALSAWIADGRVRPSV